MMYSREQVAASLYVIYNKCITITRDWAAKHVVNQHMLALDHDRRKKQRESRSKRRARDGKHTIGA